MNSMDKALDLKRVIDELESAVSDPSRGLPEEVFLLVSRITPLVNVDLLIKNNRNQTLLTWRDDEFWGPGWHVPGGIIRYKEKLADRIYAVSKNELGAEVDFKNEPLAVNEVIHSTWRNRGHFISFLYSCTLITQLDENLRCKDNPPRPNEWMWHSCCPDNLISVHDMYRRFM
jgi:ADP-ribose pyrophosphatase YjhB (NUDIX family)